MKLVAIKDIARYEECTYSYGKQSNFRLLLEAGFTLPCNPNPYFVNIPTWLDEKDPLYEEKKKLVDGQVTDDLFISTELTTGVHWNTLVSKMRFYACKDLQWIEAWKVKFYDEWEKDFLRDTPAN